MADGSTSEYSVVFDLENLVCEDKVRARAAVLGRNLTQDRLKLAMRDIADLYQRRNKVYAKEIEAILEEQQSWPEKSWSLQSIEVKVDKEHDPSVELVLTDPNGERFSASASGETTVEGIFTAVEHLTGIHAFLLDFNYSSLVPGVNSLGKAMVHIKHHDIEAFACAYSVDFLEAVAKAFLAGFGKLMHKLAEMQS